MSALTKKNLINFDENGRNTSLIRPGEADLASPGPVRIKLGHLNVTYLCWLDSHFFIGQPLNNHFGQTCNLKKISIQTQNSNKSAPARDFRKQKEEISNNQYTWNTWIPALVQVYIFGTLD